MTGLRDYLTVCECVKNPGEVDPALGGRASFNPWNSISFTSS